jgi:aspartate aminotransferase
MFTTLIIFAQLNLNNIIFMFHISDRVTNLSPSQTLAMSQKSSELKAQGVDVINLSVGEPDFNTPAHIKEAAKKAIDDNFTFYTPVAGYMSLRKAIVQNLKEVNGVDYAPEQIVVGGGAKQALCNAVLSIVNRGDEVIIPTPAWVSYVEMVKLAEGTNVLVPAGIEQDFKITPAQLREAITPRTRLIIICSPSNPTGSVYTHAELQGLVDVLKDYPDITIIADEIYQHINFTGSFTSLGAFPEIADRVVVVNGVSKAYAMTGWRIGFIAAPLPIAKAVSKLQSQYTSNPSSIAQKAAEAAYSGPQDCVEEMRVAFERRRNLVVELARQIPGLEVNVPQGAFYLFPKVSAYFGKKYGDRVIANDTDLAMYLLEEGHVATVAGEAFCLPGYIRLSYATSDDNIREAMRRIAQALAKLS